MFVLEIDACIVGFCAFCFLDQRQTIWKKALRVHPDYQGKGLSRMVEERALALFPLPIPPSLVRMRWSQRTTSEQEIEAIERRKNAKKIDGARGYVFPLSAPILASLPRSNCSELMI